MKKKKKDYSDMAVQKKIMDVGFLADGLHLGQSEFVCKH